MPWFYFAFPWNVASPSSRPFQRTQIGWNHRQSFGSSEFVQFLHFHKRIEHISFRGNERRYEHSGRIE